MKSFFILLSILFLGLGTSLNAQFLKNIYQHNKPVLSIPEHLIKKVKTIEIEGQRYLKVIQFNGYISQIPITEIDSITHSKGKAVDPSQLGNLRTVSVMGIVRNTGNAPINMAVVRSIFGGEETRTDANGVFFLNNILVYDKLGYITIEKPGFHKGSRSFLPLEQGSNRVNIQLLPMTLSGSFNSNSGGQITAGLLQLNFPANAIQQYGQPYNGIVNVYAQALDPSSAEMFDQMPGELLGGMNDSLRLLRSFGMATIELRDANYQLLQLQDSTFATLHFTIPEDLVAEAPASIDWWSFDETAGYWKHEGLAQKQGSVYVGSASHFSWWNCDIPENFVDFNGFVNSVDGIPISDAQINVVTSGIGAGITYTNSEGEFKSRVPNNRSFTLNIKLKCGTTNNWATAYSENITSEVSPITGQYTASLENRFPISGNLVNCEGQPVAFGYLKMDGQIFFTSNGQFNILACTTGAYSLLGFDTSNPDSIKVSSIISLQVDTSSTAPLVIDVCTYIFGKVIDIDGNIYPTVLIGSQLWMAENLKTTRFKNGSVIPNITHSLTWSFTETPAWCNFDNNPAFDAVYGKLYNWFAVALPDRVCPAGWHVSSEIEWQQLELFLGMSDLELDQIGWRGFSNNVGGQLKSTSHWKAPNTQATNSTNFGGLPGGRRLDIVGMFKEVDELGAWWTSTESSSLLAWGRTLRYSANDITKFDIEKQNGYSVRCIKD